MEAKAGRRQMDENQNYRYVERPLPESGMWFYVGGKVTKKISDKEVLLQFHWPKFGPLVYTVKYKYDPNDGNDVSVPISNLPVGTQVRFRAMWWQPGAVKEWHAKSVQLAVAGDYSYRRPRAIGERKEPAQGRGSERKEPDHRRGNTDGGKPRPEKRHEPQRKEPPPFKGDHRGAGKSGKAGLSAPRPYEHVHENRNIFTVEAVVQTSNGSRALIKRTDQKGEVVECIIEGEEPITVYRGGLQSVTSISNAVEFLASGQRFYGWWTYTFQVDHRGNRKRVPKWLGIQLPPMKRADIEKCAKGFLEDIVNEITGIKALGTEIESMNDMLEGCTQTMARMEQQLDYKRKQQVTNEPKVHHVAVGELVNLTGGDGDSFLDSPLEMDSPVMLPMTDCLNPDAEPFAPLADVAKPASILGDVIKEFDVLEQSNVAYDANNVLCKEETSMLPPTPNLVEVNILEEYLRFTNTPERIIPDIIGNFFAKRIAK